MPRRFGFGFSRRCVWLLIGATIGWNAAFVGAPFTRAPFARAQVPPAPAPPRVPAGFELEIVAAPPLVEHPTLAAFDDRGRLFVCDGPGLNLPADELLAQLPNEIRMLEDVDGDGTFDKSTVFADKMTFPMGALPHRGSLFVASPPSIWRLTDRDGDGVAEERHELVTKFGFTGNAADIHGCFLGPDGRLYWCDGRHGHAFVDEKGATLSEGLAARLFSCRVDGSDVQAFCGGGMDNPVETTFTEEGEPIGTVAIFDVTDGRHDALVHYSYGGVYPHHECVREFRRTGDLLPPLSRLGQTAPSGVMRYRGGQFGEEFLDNVFHAEFDTHVVVRTQIERDGSTFRARAEDFLISDDVDFHPTDVLEDADGSLLVVDTGGWFRIGCPKSVLAKPAVKGAIYRIRRTGAPTFADARGKKLAWDDASAADLARRLADSRPAVRDRAIEMLVDRGESSVAAVTDVLVRSDSDVAAIRATWVLARIGAPAALSHVRGALGHAEGRVRQTAACALGGLRDREAFDSLCALLRDERMATRREAAVALGRIGNGAAAAPLLAALREGIDRQLEHALIYALIEINNSDAVLPGLADASPDVRKGALIALDQMASGRLSREQVLPLLETDDPALRQTVLAVVEKHAEWGPEAAAFLEARLPATINAPEHVQQIRGAVLALAREPAIQKWVADSLMAPRSQPELRIALLEAIARSDLPTPPEAWIDAVALRLVDGELPVREQALSAATALGASRFAGVLAQLASNESLPAAFRAAIASTAARAGLPLGPASFDLMRSRLQADGAPAERLAAAEALGSAALDGAQLRALLSSIAAAGPLELPALLQAFERQSGAEFGAEFGNELVDSLLASPGVEGLSAARLRQTFANCDQSVRDKAAALIARLDVDVEGQRARLDALMTQLPAGDAARGVEIFRGKKAACAACHRLKGEGGAIGPDLSQIGKIRARIDLVESIVFPSASFARGYEAHTIVTKEGESLSGIIARKTSNAAYLKTAQREEIRIPLADIEEMAPSKVSIMPQGLDRVLTLQDLADLAALLEGMK